MNLGRWWITRKAANGRRNLIVGHKPDWTLALQFRPQRSFWFRPPRSTFPDKLGRETLMTGLHAFWCLELSLVRTLGKKMDLGRRLSWNRWWKKETKGKP